MGAKKQHKAAIYFPHLKNLQVCQPSMKSKQRIVVGTQVFGKVLMRDSAIEPPANGNPVNVGRLDSETNDPTREDIHDDHDPIALERNGFTAK
jgi:hypothetical protein